MRQLKKIKSSLARFLLMCIALVCILPIYAQSGKTVKGVVIDQNGEPIIGATVVVKGTSVGVISDFDGNFIINVPDDNSVISVSFIGYATSEVKANRSTLRVVLKENVQQIEEVVVVGYGVQKKESVVGAVVQVDNKSLMKAGTSNITNALSGKMSGVLTMQQSSQPGNNSAEIVIRGLSSWNGSSPLVLVDGVERDFSSIDPNEVSSISVLKDASATAVFGARGANGVIIVTTQRGREGKPKLDFSYSYGVQLPTYVPSHVDAYTTMNSLNMAMKNIGNYSDIVSDYELSQYKNPSSRINSLRYPDVNWYEETCKGYAPYSNANVSISGGSERVKYFTSLGYNYEGDFFKTYKNGPVDARNFARRFNYRTNLDFELSKSSTLSFNIGGDLSIVNNPTSSGSAWSSIYVSSSTRYPAYFPEWALEEIPDLDYPDASGIRLAIPIGDTSTNPYSDFNQPNFKRYTSSKFFTDLNFKQDLDFITKGLSASFKVSLSTYYRNQSLRSGVTYPKYQIDWSLVGTDKNPWIREDQDLEVWAPPLDKLFIGGLENGYYSDLYYEASINYQRNFGDHYVTGLALFNRQQKNKGTDFPYYNESWVGRATYDYKHKYLVEVNMGYTGSERFAPTNRFGFFPSGAVGWVLSEENFFKPVKNIVSKFKIRYSDGLVGSDLASERWLYLSDYEDKGSYIKEGPVANLYARWEEARKQDLGFELGFFNDKLNLVVDFFQERRNSMLLKPNSVGPFVGNEMKQLNLGKLKKHGMEVELGFTNSLSNGLSYNFKTMWSFSENRILYKDDLPYAPDYQKAAGKAVGAQVDGMETVDSGYFTSIDDIHNYPIPIKLGQLGIGDYKYLDYNADGKVTITDRHAVVGSKYAPIIYSFSGGLSYKGFDFSLLFSGNLGKYVDYGFYDVEFYSYSWRMYESHLNYWTPTNPNPDRAVLHYGQPANIAWGGAGLEDGGFRNKLLNHNWRSSNYLRLKEIYLGYNINTPSLKKLLGLSNLTIYATGNNVLTFTNLKEGDPERTSYNGGFYPMLATYKLGLKVTF